MRTLTPLALLASTAILPAQDCARFPGEIFPLTTSNTALAIAVGDLNDDGVPDVAGTSSDASPPYQGYAEVVLGDGRGGFSAAAAFPVGRPYSGGSRYVYDPIAIAIVELNGDGKPDLAVADFDDGEISVLLGDGTGGFSAATTFPIGGSPSSIASGDFDHDGKTDLAVTNRTTGGDAQVTVLLGDGLGGFASATSIALGTNAYPVNVVCAEMNGDGALDLVTAISAPLSHPNVALLFGDGRGGFSAPAIVIQLGSFMDMDECGIADMNGDGKQDVIATYDAGEGPRIDVRLGDGLGGFSARRTFPLSASFFGDGSANLRLAVGDLNGDGKIDVAVAGYLYLNYIRRIGIVSALLGDGQGGLSVSKEFASDGGNALAIADLDGDGRSDLALGTADGVGAMLGNGLAGFALSSFPVGPGPDSVASADLDGDGDRDLAVSTMNGVAILFGDSGSRAWSQHTLVHAGTDPNAVLLRDLDSDGAADLIVANGGSNDVSVLRGDGHGGFSPLVTHPVGIWPVALAADDLDHDGALDLVVANRDSNNVSVLLGDGHGGFSAASNFGVGEGPLGFAIGDLDGDGHPDLAVASQLSSEITLLRGDGRGGFSGVQSVFASRVQGVAIGDLNGDGAPDLAAVTDTGTDVKALTGYFQTALGTFIEKGLGSGGFTALIRDIDGDGNADVVTGGEAVHAYFGDGHGAFEKRAFLGGLEVVAFAVDDLNGDGRNDLAVANPATNTGDQTVTIMLAGCPAARAFPYGHGCAGSGGFVPTLALTGTPQPGDTVTITLANGLGGANAPVLVGLSQALLPIPGPSGCALLTSPALPLINFVLTGSGAGQGSQHIDLALPPDLPPVTLTMQGFVLDAGALQGFASSNGLEIHIE
jgi:hypothetical protein